mmetsp:Transcript_24802/g.86358  ORF Transcript_24802/g.86358 Transcript_24802/m.86358 type:complete len:250 (+) Transcript_24802:1826-2575(+)
MAASSELYPSASASSSSSDDDDISPSDASSSPSPSPTRADAARGASPGTVVKGCSCSAVVSPRNAYRCGNIATRTCSGVPNAMLWYARKRRPGLFRYHGFISARTVRRASTRCACFLLYAHAQMSCVSLRAVASSASVGSIAAARSSISLLRAAGVSAASKASQNAASGANGDPCVNCGIMSASRCGSRATVATSSAVATYFASDSATVSSRPSSSNRGAGRASKPSCSVTSTRNGSSWPIRYPMAGVR